MITRPFGVTKGKSIATGAEWRKADWAGDVPSLSTCRLLAQQAAATAQRANTTLNAKMATTLVCRLHKNAMRRRTARPRMTKWVAAAAAFTPPAYPPLADRIAPRPG